MFITKIKLANLITYVGMISALLAIIYSFHGDVRKGFICFIISGICDMFDGRFARMFKRSEMEKNIGIQMDSLSDVISFLIVPVALALGMGMDKWYNIVLYGIYVVLGITRLGFFNVFAEENKDKGPIEVYKGVAVTYSSLVFPLIYLVSYFVKKEFFYVVYLIAMFIMSILFILNINVPKPRTRGYIIFSLLAIVSVVLIIML